MIDFDDLEEEATARVEGGGELDDAARAALGNAEVPCEWQGGLMPPIPRNPRLPALQDLPEKILGTMEVRTSRGWVGQRLFVFYGAGDSVVAWRNLMNDCPGWLEVAVYEWPGHGLREADPQAESLAQLGEDAYAAVYEALKQHARGGEIEGAPFALAGHSMGAQVMLEVAMRAKRELAIEPRSVIVFDRGSPDQPLYTEEGYRLLCMEEPQEFFDGFNPMIGKLMRSSSRGMPETERMIRMWQNDLRISQEHVRSEGSFIFHCDIHVLAAAQNYAMDEALSRSGPDDASALSDDMLRVHKLNCKITDSGPESSAPFSREAYRRWRRWTSRECNVHFLNAGHVAIKTNPEAIELLMKEMVSSKSEMKIV